MSTVITSQPRAQDFPENQDENINSAINEEEEEARKIQNEHISEEVVEACCCALESAEDTWCFCQCISWCFRSLGHCTDECCEGCAECISSCCESSGETSAPSNGDDCDGCFGCDCDCDCSD